MNLLFDILNLIANVLYFLYELTIHSYIDILYCYDYTDNNLLLEHKITTVNSINNCIIDIGMDISWKTLEVVGIIKKYYNKTIVPGFHNITNDYFRNSILIIKDGKEVQLIKDIEAIECLECKDFDCDLVFYTDYTLNDTKKNYTIILPDINGINYAKDSIKDKSDVNFIIFQLSIGDTKYDINLKEPRNFLIKNNILKYPFFKWYMMKVYNIELGEEFNVNYMSQDMSIGNVHSPFFIKFNENSVTSFSSGKPKQVVVDIVEHTKDEGEINDNIITDIINNERLKNHLD
jgi:hypothetical protein